MKKIAIIGGGAAGMMAAISAAQAGAKPVIFERNLFLGKKLALTGKGRCNLTNACTIQEFMRNVPGNGSFLYSSLHRLDTSATMAFFNELGLELKIERGRRVFPLGDDAHAVVNALKNHLKRLNVQIKYNSRVKGLLLDNQSISGLKIGEEEFNFSRIIIATGGASYPGTGSTGDGYAMAKEAGHSIILPRPSLVPLTTVETWVQDLAGLSLKNIQITAKLGEKTLCRLFGEMLFTHLGVSGPVILSASEDLAPYIPKEEIKLYINLKPALSPKQIEERINRDFIKFSRKQYQNSLGELLPSSLIPVFIRLSQIQPEKPVNQINKEERKRIKELLTALPLTIRGTGGFSEAIITAGGVNTREVDPKTLSSKLAEGLYFAGEVLDINGLTGGYNLQIAWSTGFAAGFFAAQ